MNEPRFFLFFLYNIDLHNLDINGRNLETDPRDDHRWSLFEMKSPLIEEESEQAEPS